MAIRHKKQASHSVGLGYLRSSAEENKPLKVAIIISIIIHIILLWIVFPEPEKKKPEEVYQSRMVYIQPYKIYSPPKPPKKGSPIVKKKSKNIIPIPDPTPDDREPYTEAPTELPPWAIESDDAGDYEFGLPDGVPGGTGWGPIYKMSGDITPPVVIKEVLPLYPQQASKSHKTAKVYLEAIIDTDGIPQRIRVLYAPDGQYGFDKEAIKALKQWRFRPGMKDGKPVAVIMTLEVDFRLL